MTSDTQAPSLLPCPFCGSDAITTKDDGYSEWLQCECCTATGPYSLRDNEVERGLAEAWNTRADMAVKVKPLEWERELPGLLTAYAPGYEYVVRALYGGYRWHEQQTGSGAEGFDTEDGAIADAQANYDKCYVAGLELAPAPNTDTLRAENERLRAFIADFADADFPATRQFSGPRPDDELEATTEAAPVHAWQDDARDLLKGGDT